jgi:hypothetical protein
MKALSLKQPWAEFVADGKKTVELRKWNTKFRGEFLIHASKIPDMEAMKKFGFPENSLPLGVIIGKASLVDVKKYKNEGEFAKDASLHLATREWGDYGFVLDKISKLDKPIPALGKLNFWDFELKI